MASAGPQAPSLPPLAPRLPGHPQPRGQEHPCGSLSYANPGTARRGRCSRVLIYLNKTFFMLFNKGVRLGDKANCGCPWVDPPVLWGGRGMEPGEDGCHQVGVTISCTMKAKWGGR